MAAKRVREQHIAVFGESGSGKTVMVSSFYGAMQEPEFLRRSLFTVTAEDTGQGHRLHGNYLGMRDSDRRPEPTRFAATSYAFAVKLREKGPKATRSKAFDALRLVWHDYPGEWFEADVSGPGEAQRRIETFRALLSSDVAVLLVDGQRLVAHAGDGVAPFSWTPDSGGDPGGRRPVWVVPRSTRRSSVVKLLLW